jgi:hypothetical protein
MKNAICHAKMAAEIHFGAITKPKYPPEIALFCPSIFKARRNVTFSTRPMRGKHTLPFRDSLVPDPSGGSFIGNATYSTCLLCFIVYLLFQSPYNSICISNPSLFNKTITTYSLDTSSASSKSQTRVTIGPLSALHRYIGVHAIFTRHSLNYSASIGFVLSKHVTFHATSDGLPDFDGQESFRFDSGSASSNLIHLVSTRATDGLKIELLLSFPSQPAVFNGLQIIYDYIDPRAEQSRGTIRIVLTGCALYALCGYAWSLRGRLPSLRQRLAVWLGIFAVISLNPFASAFYEISSVLFSLFLIVFRGFVILLLESMCFNSSGLMPYLMVPFVAAYGILEGYSNWIRKPSIFAPVQLSMDEIALIGFHLVYFVIVGCLLAFALVRAQNRVPVVGFGLFILATLLATLVCDVFVKVVGISRNLVLPLLFYQATHVLAAVAFLFFEHFPTEAVSPRRPDEDVVVIEIDSDDD